LTERDPRFLRLRLKTWAFLLLGGCLLGGAGALILQRQGFFVRQDSFRLLTDSGDELKVGLPLKLRGFTIGSVRALELNPAGTVEVKVEVAHKYRRWLRRDASAWLAGYGLFGGTYIRVEGGTSNKLLEDNAVIHLQHDLSLEQLAQQVLHEVKPIVDESKRILYSINDPKGHINQTLANAETLSRDLQQTHRQLQDLLVSARKVTGQTLPQTLQHTTATLQSAQQAVATVQHALPGILQNLDATVSHTAVLTGDMQRLLREHEAAIGTSVRQGEQALLSTNQMFDTMRTTWPFKNVLTPPAEPVLPIDSHD